MLLGSIGLKDFSDSVCRISSASAARQKRTHSGHRDVSISTVGIIKALSQRLQIGANDITNPADFGVAVDFVDACPFLAKTIL
jgi:hypothetical protein